jgi:hypothetical protein
VQQLSAVNIADKSAAAAKQNSFPRRGGGGKISNFMTPFGCNCEGAARFHERAQPALLILSFHLASLSQKSLLPRAGLFCACNKYNTHPVKSIKAYLQNTFSLILLKAVLREKAHARDINFTPGL